MRYVFGRCRLDTSSRDLLRDGHRVALSPKAFDVLKLLIDARPRVLTKTELMEQAWPDAVVAEANLPVLIGEVRAALGDEAAASSSIKTHHGVGYSFISDVRQMQSSVDTAPAGGPVFLLRVGGTRIVLGPGVNTVGRDPDGHVFLNHSSVSRFHARIVIENSAARVEDLKSSNGTLVQGVRITEPAPLADGDELEFGSVKVFFIVDSANDSTTGTL